MIYGKEIEKPTATFQPGDRVRFIPDDEETGTYTVIRSTHTHTQLDGFEFAIANWRLRRVRKSKNSASVELR